MSNILFLYNNLLDTSTLTESSEASGFPAENVQHEFRTKVWRTEGATAGTANLDIDLGSAQEVTCVALADYTWTSAPGTFDLEFDNDSGYGSIDATESLTWSANPTANGNNGIIVKTFTGHTYRYLRLNVVYSPGGTPTDWDLGRIFVGTYFEPSDNYLLAEFQQNFIDLSRSQRTPGGSIHVDQIDPIREVEFSFIAQTQAQWESFQGVINEVGMADPLFVAFDYDNEPNEMTMYGRFTSLPNMRRVDVPYFRLGFTFEEAK